MMATLDIARRSLLAMPTTVSPLLLASSCAGAAAGPHWKSIDTIAAAGFRRYTTKQALPGLDANTAAFFATHCYPGKGIDRITLRVPVVAGKRLRVVLHFAEVYHSAAGKRQFNVLVDKASQARPSLVGFFLSAVVYLQVS
jgi:hypothetical protein